ncbi:hypothetical protein JRQ81_000372, partial [Phrynocephalus forsythii]
LWRRGLGPPIPGRQAEGPRSSSGQNLGAAGGGGEGERGFEEKLCWFSPSVRQGAPLGVRRCPRPAAGDPAKSDGEDRQASGNDGKNYMCSRGVESHGSHEKTLNFLAAHAKTFSRKLCSCQKTCVPPIPRIYMC